MPMASNGRRCCAGHELSRRGLLRIGGLACAGLAIPQQLRADSPSNDRASDKRTIRPFNRYSHLLKTVKKRGHKVRVLGYAPDRSPIVGVKAGGDKKPAIFISASTA